jgi:hypothetical protein
VPHGGRTAYPRINEDRECSWSLLIWETWRRWGCIVGWSEGEEEGGVSVEVLDGERHDVEL